MVQPLYYIVDPEDPRAPPQEMWDCMSLAEQERVCEMLPAEVPIDIMAPEGDPHREAKEQTLDALGNYFHKGGRRVYLSSELAVYYPGRRRIVPDVIAVVDADPRPRNKWVVAKEGRGVDFALEVHVEGDKAKDHERNVEIYAAYGIREYFIFDRGNNSLKGYRLLSADARVYQPILPQAGRWPSHVLGLDLCLQDEHLRFYNASSLLLESGEIIGELEGLVGNLVKEREEARRVEKELRLRLEEARRHLDEARRHAEQERARAEQERARAEQERTRAEQERTRAEQERTRANQMSELLETVRLNAERALHTEEQARLRIQENNQRIDELRAEIERLKKGEKNS